MAAVEIPNNCVQCVDAGQFGSSASGPAETAGRAEVFQERLDTVPANGL